jgi:ribose transport system substrate-binding protein
MTSFNLRRPAVTLAAVVLAAVAVITACGGGGSGGSSSSGAATPANAKGAKGAKVTLLTVAQSCDYCATHTEEFKKVATAAGIQLTTVVNNFDAAEQAQQINQAISTRPDAVVVWPADATAIQPSLARLKSANIPTVVTNSRPQTTDESLWTAYTGPDDVANGAKAAEAMISGFKAKNLTKGNVVVVVGQPGTPPAINRLKGFQDTLAKEAPDIKVVGTQPGNWDQTQATSAAASLFTQYGSDLQGIYAQADNMLAGALTAAQRANLTDLVSVGSNCSIEGYDNIGKGTQYATVLQSPIEDGQLAAQTVVKILDGQSVQKDNYLVPRIITKGNLTDCAAAVGK